MYQYDRFIYHLDGCDHVFSSIDGVYELIDDIGLMPFYHITKYKPTDSYKYLQNADIPKFDYIRVHAVSDKVDILLNYNKQIIMEIAYIGNHIFDMTANKFKYIGLSDPGIYSGQIINISDIKLPDRAIYVADGKSSLSIEEAYSFLIGNNTTVMCFNPFASKIYDSSKELKDNALNALYRWIEIKDGNITTESFDLHNHITAKRETHEIRYAEDTDIDD